MNFDDLPQYDPEAHKQDLELLEMNVKASAEMFWDALSKITDSGKKHAIATKMHLALQEITVQKPTLDRMMRKTKEEIFNL